MDNEVHTENDEAVSIVQPVMLEQSDFLQLLTECDLNWFEVIDRVVEDTCSNEDVVTERLSSLYSSALNGNCISDENKRKLQQSYLAFQHDCTRRHVLC